MHTLLECFAAMQVQTRYWSCLISLSVDQNIIGWHWFIFSTDLELFMKLTNFDHSNNCHLSMPVPFIDIYVFFFLQLLAHLSQRVIRTIAIT